MIEAINALSPINLSSAICRLNVAFLHSHYSYTKSAYCFSLYLSLEFCQIFLKYFTFFSFLRWKIQETIPRCHHCYYVICWNPSYQHYKCFKNLISYYENDTTIDITTEIVCSLACDFSGNRLQYFTENITTNPNTYPESVCLRVCNMAAHLCTFSTRVSIKTQVFYRSVYYFN